MNITAIYRIARQEFVRVITYPLVPLTMLLILAIAFLYGAGDEHSLESISADYELDALLLGFSQSWQALSMVCMVVAVFLGAITIPYERQNKSLGVLVTKPLYRRDYYLGKFLGLSSFMLVFNTLAILIVGLVIMQYFRQPLSVYEYTWRVAAYITVMSLYCSLIIALNMLFSVITRNMLVVTTLSVTYIFLDWIWYSDTLLVLGSLSTFTPMSIYFKLISPIPRVELISLVGRNTFFALFNTLVPFGAWFNWAAPLLGLLLVEMSILLLAGIHRFSRDDNV